MCCWTWLLLLMLFLQAVTSNCSVELQDTEVQDLQTQLTASLHQIRVLREQEKFLYEQLEAQKQTVEEGLMLAEQLNIRRQLVEFNSTKDWAVLRRSLEEVLDPESAAYKQLQYLKYEETWSMWYIGINGYTELATVLVTGGRDVEVQDTGSGTMLQGAALSGHTHMVEMLLDHGADMEAVSGAYCRTAIIYAAQAYRLDVVKMLAQRGANIDRGNCDGDTSLHWAVWDGHLDMVQYLVEAGASTTATNKHGHTPLEYGMQRGRTAVVQYLSLFPH